MTGQGFCMCVCMCVCVCVCVCARSRRAPSYPLGTRPQACKVTGGGPQAQRGPNRRRPRGTRGARGGRKGSQNPGDSRQTEPLLTVTVLQRGFPQRSPIQPQTPGPQSAARLGEALESFRRGRVREQSFDSAFRLVETVRLG
jgi:hypothetical protein